MSDEKKKPKREQISNDSFRALRNIVEKKIPIPTKEPASSGKKKDPEKKPDSQ